MFLVCPCLVVACYAFPLIPFSPGHVNEKNFVGLTTFGDSQHGDYITCGSENDSMYTYYKHLNDPVVVKQFTSVSPSANLSTFFAFILLLFLTLKHPFMFTLCCLSQCLLDTA